ncbi:MAG: GNAT family N-acetyltransferase [Saprospiraceae bacterium]
MEERLTYGPARTDDDLRGIQAIQAANLPDTLTEEESREQGFVSIRHELDLLRLMNQPHGHTVARDASGRVVGYALVMEPRHRETVPFLLRFFTLLDTLTYRGKPLAGYRYFSMGQIAVAKDYRGQGVFRGLYHDLFTRTAPHFDLVVTAIALSNVRSRRAHERVGFEDLHFYEQDGKEWVVVGVSIGRGE